MRRWTLIGVGTCVQCARAPIAPRYVIGRNGAAGIAHPWQHGPLCALCLDAWREYFDRAEGLREA